MRNRQDCLSGTVKAVNGNKSHYLAPGRRPEERWSQKKFLREKNFVARNSNSSRRCGRAGISDVYLRVQGSWTNLADRAHGHALTTGLILHWDHKPVEERTKESTEDATGVVLEWDFWYMNRVPKV